MVSSQVMVRGAQFTFYFFETVSLFVLGSSCGDLSAKGDFSALLMFISYVPHLLEHFLVMLPHVSLLELEGLD
jgi:hypothetical protein